PWLGVPPRRDFPARLHGSLGRRPLYGLWTVLVLLGLRLGVRPGRRLSSRREPVGMLRVERLLNRLLGRSSRLGLFLARLSRGLIGRLAGRRGIRIGQSRQPFLHELRCPLLLLDGRRLGSFERFAGCQILLLFGREARLGRS